MWGSSPLRELEGRKASLQEHSRNLESTLPSSQSLITGHLVKQCDMQVTCCTGERA